MARRVCLGTPGDTIVEQVIRIMEWKKCWGEREDGNKSAAEESCSKCTPWQHISTRCRKSQAVGMPAWLDSHQSTKLKGCSNKSQELAHKKPGGFVQQRVALPKPPSLFSKFTPSRTFELPPPPHPLWAESPSSAQTQGKPHRVVPCTFCSLIRRNLENQLWK